MILSMCLNPNLLSISETKTDPSLHFTEEEDALKRREKTRINSKKRGQETEKESNVIQKVTIEREP